MARKQARPSRPMDKNYQYIERRKRPDRITRAIPVISFGGWLAVLVAIACLQRAKPANDNVFTRFLNLPLESGWNTGLLRVALLILLSVLVLCAVSVFLSMTRQKRKADRYSTSPIILGSITLIFTIIFLIRFRGFF